MADIVNVDPEIPQEDPNHVQSMVQKFENQNSPPEQAPEGELLAGKYKTEEELLRGIGELLKHQAGDGKDLVAIYKELESNLGKPKEDPQQEPLQKPKQIEGDPENTKGSEEQIFNGINFEDFTKELEENGVLSEGSYEKLAEAGIPKHVVDAYVEGLKATAEREAQTLYSVVGGEESYNSMIQWAGSALTEDEKVAFNEALLSGGPQAKFAVEALYGRYVKDNGSPPKSLVQGSSSGGSVGDVYQSRAQLTADMNDPRYKSDPAFRQQVMDKLGRSNIL